MNTKTTLIIVVLLLLITFGASAVFSKSLPDTMVSHWNAQGQADGYSSKTTALLLLPVMQIFIVLLIMILPRLDPLKRNIDTFQPQYNVFVVCFSIFFTYLHVLTLVFNTGVRMEFVSWMMPGMGLLFIAVGELIKVAKPNYFIGIRTPWTLSNHLVWEDTHRVGGIAFKVCGALCILGAFFPKIAILFVMIPILGTALGLYAYSYIRFTQIAKSSE